MSAEDKASQPPEQLEPGLYLVATPIGNLEDITLRALRVLRGADAIACEDTRVSIKLLNAYEIKKPLLAYHDHNADAVRPQLIARMQAGQAIALISDAGTPLVSDPGFKLARDCSDAGVAVIPIPGPSAVLAALSTSALPTDRFMFAGFLPTADAARKTALRDVADVKATLVFFESAPRLTKTLAAMHAMLGDRPAAVARELTKKFEQTRRGTLASLARHYAAQGAPKGEIVILVGSPDSAAPAQNDENLDECLETALKSLSLKEAVANVSAQLGIPRRVVYARALTLTRGKNDGAP
jgi:16S rRNA (cytidine1402-2'-O)-methyltransferase